MRYYGGTPSQWLDEPEPLVKALAKMVPRLQAEEALLTAQVIYKAGSLAATVAAQSKEAVESAVDGFNQFVSGLQAQVLGTVGQEVDALGRTVLKGAKDMRRWFMEEGGLAI